jgi:hypothetical protein
MSEDRLSCLEPIYADGIFAENAVTKAVLFARVDADCRQVVTSRRCFPSYSIRTTFN